MKVRITCFVCKISSKPLVSWKRWILFNIFIHMDKAGFVSLCYFERYSCNQKKFYLNLLWYWVLARHILLYHRSTRVLYLYFTVWPHFDAWHQHFETSTPTHTLNLIYSSTVFNLNPPFACPIMHPPTDRESHYIFFSTLIYQNSNNCLMYKIIIFWSVTAWFWI